MNGMILAAGLGTRMRPLTDHCPKPLLKVGAKPLIQHHVENMARAGIARVVINTCYLGHMIEEELGNGDRFGISIIYQHETKILGTGGGIINALPHLGDKFILMNGDVYTDINVPDLCSFATQSDCDGLLVLVENPPHNIKGDFFLNRQKQIATKGKQDDQRLTYSGVAFLTRDMFDGFDINTFSVVDVFKRSIANQRLHGLLHSGTWSDVGTPERFKSINAQLGGN